jgi:uncharacterized Zn finger protein
MSTEFGGSWWGQRWIEALERLSTAWQNRLPRGRDYALKGHVISLAVSGGKISAKVQGSRSKPYATTLEVPALRDTEWVRVIDKLAAQARFPAQLLVGVMPADIEEVFNAEGVSLFPMRNSEMLGSCSCPDKARPCKHIAAVHYAFGQALDRDPFLLFQLRGADRERLLQGFYGAWFDEVADDDTVSPPLVADERGLEVIPLSADRFNRSPQMLDGMSFTPFEDASSRLILERLGAPRSWSLPIGITDLLGPVYDEVTALASSIAVAGFDTDLLPDDDHDDGIDDHDVLDDDSYDDDDLDDDSSGATPVVPTSRSIPTQTVAENEQFKALPFGMPQRAQDDVGAVPRAQFALPSSLGMAAKSVKPAETPPPEEEKSSKVLIRKGVAAMSRRKKKPAPSIEGVASAEVVTPTTAPATAPSDFVPTERPDASPAVAVRRRRVATTEASGAVPVVRRRRAVVPTGDATAVPMDDDAPVDLAAADATTLIALGKNLPADALVVVRKAWRAEPTLQRFLLMMAAAKGADSVSDVLEEEAAFIVEDAPKRSTSTAALLLLMSAGHYKDTADRVRSLGKRAWKGSESPGATFVPFACAVTTHGRTIPQGAYVSRTVDALYRRGEGSFSVLDTPPEPVGAWLARALEATPPPGSLVPKLLGACRELCLALIAVPRVDASGQKADQVAAFIVATAEAMALNEDGAADAFLIECQKALDPKRRLTQSIGKAVATSPILS